MGLIKKSSIHIYILILLLSIFIIRDVSYASDKPRLLVVDTPLDYSLFNLKKNLNRDKWNKISIKISSQDRNLWEVNELERSKFKLSGLSKVDSKNSINKENKQFEKNLDNIDLLMNSKETSKDMSGLYKTELFFRSMMPGTSNELISTLWQVHGSHVAGISTDGLEGMVELYSYPMIEFLDHLDQKLFETNFIYKKIEESFNNLSQIIASADIQFVNISAGSSKKMILNMFEEYSTLKQKLQYAQKFPILASLISTKWTGELEKLINKHSKTLFIIAAGNESEWIDLQIHSSSKLRSPNLIVVGALSNNKLAKYSNYSNKYVTIGVEGKAKALVTNLRKLSLEGTSSATPKVTQCLLRVSLKNPNLTPLQAKERVFQEFASTHSELGSEIKKGLVLDFEKCRKE